MRHFGRKAWLTIIAAIGPEFLLYIAMCQWLSAGRSVVGFRQAGHSQWTMKHAFLADMGGFRLKTPGAESFPLNAQSLLYLIEEGHINERQAQAILDLDPQTIEDRNKADSAARLVAVVQSLWFGCNVAARYAQGLAVTTLELTVIGFLAPTVATYLCWWHKPRDVMTSQTISINVSLPTILQQAGVDISTEWHRSPLDFIERAEFHGSLCYRYWINILKHVARIPAGPTSLACKGTSRYIQARQRRSDNDILAYTTHWKHGWIEVVPTIPYLAINFAAWNFHFPSPVEQWMWRGSSIAMAATFLIGAAIEVAFLAAPSAESEKHTLQRYRADFQILQQDRHKHKPHARRWVKYCWEALGRKLRNNSMDDDPDLDVPIRLLIPATVFAAIYLLGRMYILIEDIIAFRSMPSSTFETVEWTAFLPQIS